MTGQLGRRCTALARSGLMILLIAMLAACSASGDFTAAEQQVPAFHSMLDHGNYQSIYAASTRTLKDTDSEDKFGAFLDAVHQKLGAVKSTRRVNSGIRVGTSGTFVTLIYKTAFSSGDATETFVYRINRSKALLAGYHINSDALIEK